MSDSVEVLARRIVRAIDGQSFGPDAQAIRERTQSITGGECHVGRFVAAQELARTEWVAALLRESMTPKPSCSYCNDFGRVHRMISPDGHGALICCDRCEKGREMLAKEEAELIRARGTTKGEQANG